MASIDVLGKARPLCFSMTKSHTSRQLRVLLTRTAYMYSFLLTDITLSL